MRVLPTPKSYDEYDLFGFTEDFDWYIITHRWTTLVADGGGTAVTIDVNDPNGVMSIVSGGTDNHEAILFTANEMFTIAADKPHVFDCRLQFTEANTDDANVFAGFTSEAAANLMVDDGAGPNLNMTAAAIFKVDGGTVWKCITSNGTTQTITASTTTAGGASYQRLRVEIQPIDTTNCEVTFYVDNVPLVDTNGNQIKHTLAIASAAAMGVAFCIKSGGANAETLLVDRVDAWKLR